MVNKTLRILADDKNGKLELMKHRDDEYFCRYGFAATELYEFKEKAIAEGILMKKTLDNEKEI